MNEDELMEETAENLFPEEDEDLTDEEILEEETEDVGYKTSLYWDSEKRDLVLDGKGSIVKADPLQAWIQWCIKALETPRYDCLAYTDNYGIDIVDILTSSTREQAESILYAEISESLSADPYGRTEYVESIEFDWISPDSVHVTCVIVGMDTTEAIEAVIHA